MSDIQPLECLPTFANIKAKFDAIYEHAVAGDFFFFHYSGHGARFERQKNSPKRNMLSDPSLITVDFCCGQPAWLRRLNEKGIQVVVTLDSCYSGGSWRSARDSTSFRTPIDWSLIPNLPADDQAAATFDETTERASRGAKLETSWSINPENFTVMTACGIKEKAAEIVVNGKIHEAFTWELLDYLRDGGGRGAGRGGGDIHKTYRTILDQLNMRLKDQSPEVHGRDKLLFFRSSEPFGTTALIVQQQDSKVVVPAGRAHGVNVGSEFVLFSEMLNQTLSVDKVDEFWSSAVISDRFSQLLKQHFHTVIFSRWNLGEEETLQVYVDPAFGSNFRSRLQKQLKNWISSPIEILGSIEDRIDVLRLDRLGDDDVEIRGPAWLTGFDDPERPLNLINYNTNNFSVEAAVALAHLARFRQILLLRSQASRDPLPFNVSIKPAKGEPTRARYPLKQKFRYTFENKSDRELHITVVVFNSPQSIDRNQKKCFKFSMALPNGPEWTKEVLCRTHRRDIFRTLVTRGTRVSWKCLELPNIWDAGQTELSKKPSFTRGNTLGSEPASVDWWVYDEQIITSSAEGA
ncbi:caspase domain-containing protein [Trichoderma chlorosporum]